MVNGKLLFNIFKRRIFKRRQTYFFKRNLIYINKLNFLKNQSKNNLIFIKSKLNYFYSFLNQFYFNLINQNLNFFFKLTNLKQINLIKIIIPINYTITYLNSINNLKKIILTQLNLKITTNFKIFKLKSRIGFKFKNFRKHDVFRLFRYYKNIFKNTRKIFYKKFFNLTKKKHLLKLINFKKFNLKKKIKK